MNRLLHKMNSKRVKMCSKTLPVREMQKQDFLKVTSMLLYVHKFAKIKKKATVMTECW